MTFISGNIATVISGSYRRHLPGMYRLKRVLERKGITVLSPVGDGAINPGEEFVLLDADPIHDHRALQDSVFAKIRRSTFLTSFNRDGYLGKAALLRHHVPRPSPPPLRLVRRVQDGGRRVHNTDDAQHQLANQSAVRHDGIVRTVSHRDTEAQRSARQIGKTSAKQGLQ